MEVIYGNKKNNQEVKLPLNIKKYGKTDGRCKVYIEDYAYTFINGLKQDEYEDGITGLLLGEVKKNNEGTYIFVKGAVEVTNAAVFADRIAFTEETWPIANSRVREFFPDMKIIGWYLNSTTISDMEIIKKAHKESFNEEDNIFFMINSKDNSPKLFMGSEGNLKALDGYTVYYEKNEEMQNYMTDVRKDHAEFSNEFSDESTGRYRQMLNEKRAASKSTKRNFTIIYGLSMFLLIVVLIIGVNNINSYDKMKDKTDGETKIAGSEDPTTKKNTPVESVNGDVETTPKQEEAETTTPAESPTTKPTEPETTTPAPTEAATTAAQYDTYTVKAGDSFISICKQFYGNENMADVGLIRDANNMGENDELLIGMEIKIPRK